MALKALKFFIEVPTVEIVNKQYLLQITEATVTGSRKFLLSRGAGVDDVVAKNFGLTLRKTELVLR